MVFLSPLTLSPNPQPHPRHLLQHRRRAVPPGSQAQSQAPLPAAPSSSDWHSGPGTCIDVSLRFGGIHEQLNSMPINPRKSGNHRRCSMSLVLLSRKSLLVTMWWKLRGTSFMRSCCRAEVCVLKSGVTSGFREPSCSDVSIS